MKILDYVKNLIENSTPEAPAWNLEVTMLKKETKWNYIDGCMMKAAMDIYYATKDKYYFDFVKGYIDYFVRPDGSILGYEVEEYNCDQVNMGKVLFDLYEHTGEEKYEKAIKLIKSQLDSHPRIPAGNYWHKLNYPHQVWLDGLYMVQPFYAMYETTFGDGSGIEDIVKQFDFVFDTMLDKKTGLYYHGYDDSKSLDWADTTTGLSPNFWSRSIGWFAMAMADTAEIIGPAYFYKQFQCLMDSLLKVQDSETKLFYQVTNMGHKEGNYLETSGSAAIAYAFMKGSLNGLLPIPYFNYGHAIFDSLIKHKLDIEKFVLKDICLVAGLGGMPGHGDYKDRDGTFEYYISEPKVNNDAKGLAPFLFTFGQLLCKYLNQGVSLECY